MRESCRFTLLILLAVAVFVPALPAGAATIVNPVADFGSGYAKEGTRAADNPVSINGDVLTIVGSVVQFQSPLDILDANDPLLEYTFVFEGLVSTGTQVTDWGFGFIEYLTDYTGGTFKIVCDDTPDADFANPATYGDGEIILSGDFSGFYTYNQSFSTSGNQNADIQFTGGTLFHLVSDAGIGFMGIDTGLFVVASTIVPLAQRNQGYFALSDTEFTIDPPLPVQPTSWGAIKRLYD